ncbi:MAG: aminomethyl-transferring glycine dehydrogenase [Bacteroidales bacterium]|nr:aminomethyl-transferring glycine dehydrogenase [Bacteroidales bacterium]MCF8328101.1 aminomethyl-transferring glycine dehydrogenase [Bacteroidales bacterium]
MITNNFSRRHNGPNADQVPEMLKKVGVQTLDELIDKTIPKSIRLDKPLSLPEGINEKEYIEHIKSLGEKNKIYKTFIGLGYYNTILPGVIQRNVLENPGWYTSYTPYQAEISQGRLEALLNFQTVITDLTGFNMANASLLDEATAAAEAMSMSLDARSRKAKKRGAVKFFVDDRIFPQTKDVLMTRAVPMDIELVFGNFKEVELDDTFFGALVQYPDINGEIHDYKQFIEKAHENEMLVSMAADILSLTLLTPPAELGADIALGSTQRFGIPMGFGGPHAAYFATEEKYKRNIPGRIIGISKDKEGNQALRMALQTREQHIKRERATSNICTAQALLASMAGFYATYHGPKGLKNIAEDIHALAKTLAKGIEELGFKQLNQNYFDTLAIELDKNGSADQVIDLALKEKMNFRKIDASKVGISLDETTTLQDVQNILTVFGKAADQQVKSVKQEKPGDYAFDSKFVRKSEYLTHPVFNTYHSETDMMRYMTSLENKDLALNRTMIPLGSCTMKLNAAAELFSLSWPEFGEIHPFVPKDQAKGYYELIDNLEEWLKEVTGYSAVSFQPNSGAAGEHTGLLTIRAYHQDHGESHRNITLVPSSAHGTNPASAVMAGTKVVVVESDKNGNISLDDLRKKAEEHKDNLAAIMITYPSTHGVFEEDILEIIDIVHENGGLVYLDGANMNAQVGLTNPGIIGADVCHLNLHKTFAIPHGGGGPGVGPIGVNEKLKPYLPSHKVVKTGGSKAIGAVAAAPFGSPLILPISYGYLRLLGGDGLTEATKISILNANYLKAELSEDYDILYKGANGNVAHEMIVDCNPFHKSADITEIDIAKRLADYSFHAPTVAFPVHGTLMVEPTESEPLPELDRFVTAMKSIRKEIKEIEEGKADKENNVIKNAPHTASVVVTDEWNYPYTREKAVFPVDSNKGEKYWPPVTRVDDAYGDRHLVCTCEPIDSYREH